MILNYEAIIVISVLSLSILFRIYIIFYELYVNNVYVGFFPPFPWDDEDNDDEEERQ
jgi:hypothetical protein